MIRQFSSGGVVYKQEGNQYLFLLRKGSINSQYKGSGDWSLPKGWLDDSGPDQPGPLTLGQKRATEYQIQSAATREVEEETGIRAKVISRLGNVQFVFIDHNHQKVFKTVIFYLMQYDSDSPTGFGFETSEIAWVTVDEANKLLGKRKRESDLISKAYETIQTSNQF